MAKICCQFLRTWSLPVKPRLARCGVSRCDSRERSSNHPIEIVVVGGSAQPTGNLLVRFRQRLVRARKVPRFLLRIH